MPLLRTIHAIRLDPADLTVVNSFARKQELHAASHATVEDFLRASQPGEAAIVVLNLGGAGEQGLDALRQIHEHSIFAPVVVLSESPSVALAVRAMQTGAAAVLPHARERIALESEMARALEMEEQQRTARTQRETLAQRLGSLNEGEREVLARLMSGMANKNIAAELQIGLRTVELRRAKILKKLGAKSLAEMVRLVLLAEPDRLYPK